MWSGPVCSCWRLTLLIRIARIWATCFEHMPKCRPSSLGRHFIDFGQTWFGKFHFRLFWSTRTHNVYFEGSNGLFLLFRQIWSTNNNARESYGSWCDTMICFRRVWNHLVVACATGTIPFKGPRRESLWAGRRVRARLGTFLMHKILKFSDVRETETCSPHPAEGAAYPRHQ
jgi:hypothetical protein